MAKTPLSSSTAYATGADCLTYHDERQWGDYLLDNNQRQISVANDPRIDKALKRASGMVEAACLVGEKYTPDDLAALTGASKELLVGIVVELAFWIVSGRRSKDVQAPPMTAWALDHLQMLRDGSRIFGLQESAEAGLPQTSFVTQDQIDTLNLTTNLARRFYGRRAKEERLGP